MSYEALLLTRAGLSSEDCNIAKLVEFFGMEWHVETTKQFLTRDRVTGSGTVRLFCSATVFLELLKRSAPCNGEINSCWWKHVHSVFVYGDDAAHTQELARALTKDDRITANGPGDRVEELRVANDPQICGVMAAVRITGTPTVVTSLPGSKRKATGLISTTQGAIFLKLQYEDVPVFLSTSNQIIDLDSQLTTGIFNIHDHVPTALPIVLYIRWAFAGICWQPAENNACVVIDDPLLTRRYGHLNFEEFLELSKLHRFSTSIAFIPWNWSRGSRKTARLFVENPDFLSLSIHGCDHTRTEFGNGSWETLYFKAQKALERMASHESKTGVGFDRVMIFPHGAFSEAALSALKHTQFIAAADHGTISVDQYARKIVIRDVWEGAVTSYSGFPIFTRRDPREGIENFAFDMLLGKPALIGIHHDGCSDGYSRLIDFVDRLNDLNCDLHWRSLGQIVKRSYWQRNVSPSLAEVRMYGAELEIENRSDQAKQFVISKRESDPSLIEEIQGMSSELRWRISGDRISFEVVLEPDARATFRVRLLAINPPARRINTIPHRFRVLLRRYASELRDNYVMTNKLVLATPLRDLIAAGPEFELPRRSTLGDRSHRQDRSVSLGTPMRPGSDVQKAAEGFDDQVSYTLTRFADWLERYGETSWDHQSFFAGTGGLAKALYYHYPRIGTVAVAPMIFCEALLPAARRLFHHRIRFPIADAHYAMGFAFLYEANPQCQDYLDKAIHFLNELEVSRSPDFKEYCWGYPFKWVTRYGSIKKQTPLITTTPYCYEAFLQVAEIVERNTALSPQPSALCPTEILDSIARHASTDIRDFSTSETASSCGYTPFDQSGGVINAAAYRAFLLTSASRVFSNQDYFNKAKRNLNFVLESQKPDGSWPYAMDSVRDFVDHYHTCFVMKALAKIHQLTGHRRILPALHKGIGFYLENLLDEGGLPKPFARAPRLTVYRRELYDFAECINLCLLLRDRFPELESVLQRVVKRVLEVWVKPDGSFRSRRLHLGWDNVPMHRWGQAQMFRSLAFYLRNEALPTEGNHFSESRRVQKKRSQVPSAVNNVSCRT